jgi:hypothetical protein
MNRPSSPEANPDAAGVVVQDGRPIGIVTPGQLASGAVLHASRGSDASTTA